MGKRAHRAPSIVGWFFPPLSLVSVADSVALEDDHFALVAARELLAAIRENAQHGNTLAIIPDERTGVVATKRIGVMVELSTTVRGSTASYSHRFVTSL